MEDFLKMDIFFAITTFVVVVWGLIGAILLVVMIRVLRHIERLSRTVADGAEDIRGDLDDLRTNVREEGVRLKHIYEFFVGATTSSKLGATTSSKLGATTSSKLGATASSKLGATASSKMSATASHGARTARKAESKPQQEKKSGSRSGRKTNTNE